MQGDPGGAGFRGGNSGNFEIVFFEAHHMTLFHTIQSGAGGAGGIGGAGSDPLSSVNLEQGAQGATGSVGANGDREFSYLQDLSGRKIY